MAINLSHLSLLNAEQNEYKEERNIRYLNSRPLNLVSNYFCSKQVDAEKWESAANGFVGRQSGIFMGKIRWLYYNYWRYYRECNF